MDTAGAPMPPPDASSPPPYPGQGSAAFPISIVIAIGFMVTSLILITYYFLVVRCWLRGGGGGTSLILHRARRGDRRMVERVSAVFFTDNEAAELPGGLDPDVVAALPVVRYNRCRGKESSASECAVCLGEFAQGERLKQLPTCSHAFHIDCIDTWLHHNVSCPLCRTVVTGGAVFPLARDDHGDASCRDLQPLGDGRRIDDAAGRVGYGSSCRFPTKAGAAAQEPITRSFSMDCFAGGLGRKPLTKEPPPAASSGEAGPSLAADGSSSNNVADRGAGETSGRFRRLLSSFGLGRSSRSTVLPIHLEVLDP